MSENLIDCVCNESDPLQAQYRTDIACIALIKFRNMGITDEIIKSFESSTKDVIYPWNPRYNSLRIDVNRRFNVFPLIIVMARTVSDVQTALNFAIKYKLQVCARSGGHSNEAYSLCTGMVIDQSMRKEINVNTEKMCVNVEAGVLNGDLVAALAKYNLMLPVGTCPNVGISGLVLGGGVGFAMRQYALTCDNLIEFDIILADGSLVTVNEKNNADLFWACRGGGGGNFGIVVNFTFKVHPVGDVTIFEITHDIKYIEETLQLWQKWAPKIDSRLTAEYNVVSSNSLVSKQLYESIKPKLLIYQPKKVSHIIITGLFLGDQDELTKLLKPFKDLKVKYESFMIKRVSFIESARNFAGKPHRLPFYKNKTFFVDEAINICGIKMIKKFFENAPTDSRLEFQAFGGALSKVPAEITAFQNRKALFWCNFGTSWYDENYQDIHMKWVRELWDSFLKYSNHQCYVNFPDEDLGKKYMKYYYGKNRKRLIAIKKKYDPTYIFNFHQVIREISNDKKHKCCK
jgi:hypothetical protein